MNHPIYRITSVECIAPYKLRLGFDDGLWRTVDLDGVLEGELFGPLRDLAIFAQVRLDPEVHTVVWPSGADFDRLRSTIGRNMRQPFERPPSVGVPLTPWRSGGMGSTVLRCK